MTQAGTTRLREVSGADVPQEATQQASQASIQLLLLALKALSQRTLVALAALRGMILAGTVFWVSLVVMADPSPGRLIGLGLYAAFILAMLVLGKH